jgi:putative alpha-1,2-mannosidase
MSPLKTPITSFIGRRSFLKRSSLALAATALAQNEQPLKAESLQSPPPNPVESPANSVTANPLQGTDSSFRFSRGNTLPITARPFGMAHWTIQSNEGTAWMFEPSIRRIQGFRCTHQLSPWLSDYGQAVFLPVTGAPKPGAEARSSSWRLEDATLMPHSFKLKLLRYQNRGRTHSH